MASSKAEKTIITMTKYVPEGPAAADPERMMTGASGRGAMLPAHCVVQGEIEPRTGADGKHYGIRFEIRFPDNWQQRLMFQGGGGSDGFLANALGTVPTLGSSALPALARGYAVVSMDGGHPEKDISFGNDQQARLEFAYAAIGKVTMRAKQFVTQYYASAPAHSYFMGCSNGGREAMIAAQRYPLEFDGVVAGNAGFRLSRAAVAEAWDTQAFMKIAPKDAKGRPILSEAFSEADLKIVGNGVRDACDGLDGIKDGLINDYGACRFKPAALQCASGKQADCLSKAQVNALDAIFGGPKNSKGEALYSSWPYDTGIASTGWRVWKLGFSKDAGRPDALNATLGSDSLTGYFMTPPAPGFDTLTFDFDRDMSRVQQTGALNDATSTFMNTFSTRGSKLIAFHGMSDPVFSAHDIMTWFDSLTRDTNGGDVTARAKWARLFMVPGMTHCGGGPALDDFDPLGAIEQWVETGKEPSLLAATGEAFPGKNQPLCSYPAIARYQTGDPNHISSYRCVAPPR
ncbi:tannase/feruloyl esterase family alpha/beta hydrolase [Sphaerotilus hippei]|nr:tannase/feruloyl esterase family alpha/beta hydrolase [Sphaerotilus hippei]